MKIKASYHQERLWSLHHPGSEDRSEPRPVYHNIPLILEIDGALDSDLLEQSLGIVINRHEALRTRMIIVEDQLFQQVEPKVEFKLQVKDLSNDVQRETHESLLEMAVAESKRPFLLDGKPLARAALIKVSSLKNMLVIILHHLVADRCSLDTIAAELVQCYRALKQGSTPDLPDVPLHYADFSQWQHELPQDFLESLLFYWKRQLSRLSPLELPVSLRRAGVHTFREARAYLRLPGTLSAKIRDFCRQKGCSSDVLLLAAFKILLHRYCRQEDIVVGTSVDNRHQPGTEHIVGPAANLLVLRSNISSTMSFSSYFHDLTQTLEQVHENQDIPFERLAMELNSQEDNNPTGFFNVFFQYREKPFHIPSVKDLDIKYLETNLGWGRYDLNLFISGDGESFSGVLVYNREYYQDSFISRLVEHYHVLLESILQEPGGVDRPIARLDIFTPEERHRLLVVWNQAHTPYPKDKNLHQLFEEQVERTPDHIAAAVDIGRQHITYRELDERANLLALHLCQQSDEENRLVGMMVDKSSEMIIGILAILKSGCGYVPINPRLPAARVTYILDECHARILLTTTDLYEEGRKVSGWEGEAIFLEEQVNVELFHAPYSMRHARPGDLAYVIFTSGSTGKPKGVPITHANLSPLLHWGYRQLGLGGRDRVIQNLSYYFDWSVWEIFITLTTGACLTIVPDDVLLDAGSCAAAIHKQKVTALHITPTQYKYLVQAGHRLETLKYLCIGAEQLSLDLVRRSFESVGKGCRVFNMYGPTECTIISSVLEIDPTALDDFEHLSSVPIGPPAANATYFILDNYFEPCPPMVTGELYIGGSGVAAGYLNDPKKSFNAFIDNPLDQGQKCYKTGDLARWLPDGTVEFLGRIDHQVKIRGYRIELGEIENQLLKHPDIRETVVLVNEDAFGDTYICAYLVSGQTLSMEDLKQYLAQHLPDYMVPAYFMQIEILPLNPNGKIDRKALPDPWTAQDQKERIPPRNRLEETLAGIWAEVLGIKKEVIGINDDFFELGGHSLKATALIAKIHQQLDVKLPLVELFEAPTLRELSDYITGLTEDKYAAIEPVEIKEYFLLSPAQKRMYILQQMVPENISYNMPQTIPCEFLEQGEAQRLEETLKKLVIRHESLRTSFEVIDGEPVQKIHETVDFSVSFFQAADAVETEAVLEDFIKPFDLAYAPLWRIGVLQVRTGQHLLLLDMHHIISDGVSNEVMIRDFAALYEGRRLPELRIQYKDFAQWLHRPEVKETIRQQENYWLKEFQEEIPILNLPIDYPRPAVQSFEGSCLDSEVSAEHTRALEAAASAEGATLFIVLTAVINVMFSKLSGQEDIIIGTPVAGRRHADLQKIIGMFINTLALRNDPKGEKTFNQFLREVKENTLKAFDNQEYPFEDLVEKVDVNRDASRNPLFDVMFALQTFLGQDLLAPDQDQFQFRDNIAKFDFTVVAAKAAGEKLWVSFQYCTKLFRKKTIERFTTYFKKIVSSVVKNPDIKLWQIEIISEEEKRQILHDFNDTNAFFRRDKTINQLFEEQVKRTVDGIAVIGSEHRTGGTGASTAPGSLSCALTYGKLNEQANQLARLLQKKGVKGHTIVGILLDRSIELITSILAALKAGGAYLPIDLDYPQERIRFMLADSSVAYLITHPTAGGEFRLKEIVEPNAGDLTRLAHSNLGNHSEPDHLIYVIYTSGSTGRPKGVPIKHRGFVNLVGYHQKVFGEDQNSRMSQVANPAFDAMAFEVWPCLLNGAALHIVDNETRMAPAKMKEWLIKREITISFQPTVMAERLLSEPWPEEGVALKALRAAGSRLNRYPVHSYSFTFYNLYGPTEDTVWTTWTAVDVKPGHEEFPPIGKPIGNHRLYIIGLHSGLQPVGCIGELCIGGVALAEGYLNRPQLTADKFVPNPYVPGELIYKTGDLVRWLPDGNIDFLGRSDCQVKIRGYRIELGEIENRLLQHEDIREVVVLVRGEEREDNYLCAYFVSGRELSTETIKQYLSGNLPDYMIPSYFVSIEKIPLTSNGKINHKALPAPGLPGKGEVVLPRDELECRLVAIWASVLRIPEENIGIATNFFRLGGHSLKATVMVSKVHEEMDVKLPLVEIFTNPTVQELAECIKGLAGEQYTAIEPVEKKEYHVLSSAQRRIFILQQMEPENTAYNMPQIIPLGGEVNIEKLEEAFIQLIKRHESLRTSFLIIDEEPVQRIHDQVDFEITSAQSIQGFVKPFDLSHAPLLRASLVKSAKNQQLLAIDMHHVISDGVSNEILSRDYMALSSGETLSPLRIQYKDFAQWQTGKSQKKAVAQQEAFWLKTFEGELPLLDLPCDYPRPAVQSFDGDSVEFEISADFTRALKSVAVGSDATMYMVLLAIFNILLSKLSGQEDVIVGSPTAGRRHADLEKIIGMFVNTLALRNHPRGEKTFAQFLEEVKEKALNAFDNQDYPFEDLVEKIAVIRDASRNPLFDVMFVLQTFLEQEASAPDQDQYQFEEKTAKFDLTVIAAKAPGDKLWVSFQYCTKLFRKETIQRLITYFKKIISSVVEDPAKKLWQIETLSEVEKRKILYDFSDIETEYPLNKTLHQLFEIQADKTPDHVSLIFHDRTLSYRELNRKANQLAQLLKAKGSGPEKIVGILLQRSIEMIVSILAVLKSGGAYLPIDFLYPAERIRYILEDSDIRILLTESALISNLSFGGEIIPVDDQGIYHLGDSNPGETNGAMDIAYIIYTSGSTGTPRGVMIEHFSVINLGFYQKERFKITAEERILQFSSISFDASVEQIFIAFYSGAALVLIDRETLLGKDAFEAYVLRHGITHIHAVPSFLESINMNRSYPLKRMIAGGDICPVSLVTKWHGLCDFYNEYGPTETTVTSIEYLVTHTHSQESLIQLPIGKAVGNTKVYLLDRFGQPVSGGVPGELYIGGVGAARGYLNNPELTKERFLENPFSSGECFYRTGDLVRRSLDGNIEFLGRIDHQVKIRGYRIEPGEIESHLLKYPGVKGVVIVARADASGDKYLCAYLVTDPSTSTTGVNPEEFKKYLSHKLPDYMVPAYFMPIEKIPLTPNGKADRKALPIPEINAAREYRAPGNEIETKLVEIWAEVLGIKTDIISIDANFFQLGGHSLKATVMLSRIHKELGAKIHLAKIFDSPTVQGLAKCIKGMTGERYTAIEPVEKKEYYILSSAQKRIFILQQMEPENTAYNMPQVIPLAGEINIEKLEEVFIQLIERHESLRTSFLMIDEEPVQRIHDQVDCEITSAQTIWSFVKPFDLSHAPLLRVGLIKIADDQQLLVVDMHHVISDGVSNDILSRDYMALSSGETLPPLRIQYKDFAEWQTGEFQKKAVEQQEVFWLKIFEGEIPFLNLPLDHPRPVVQSFEGDTVNFEISGEKSRGLKTLALESNATLYMVLLAIFNMFLSKLSGQDDIIVGTPTAGRRHPDLQKIIGMFVNTLALRNYPNGRKSVNEFLKEVKEQTLEAFENQEYPFEDLVEKAPVQRDMSRNPLFDVMLILQNIGDDAVPGPGDAWEAESSGQDWIENRTAKFDLTMVAAESGETILFFLNYCTRLFKRETVERFVGYFKTIVSTTAEKPDGAISGMEIITGDEKRRILEDFNNTDAPYSGDKTLHRLFEEQVETMPHRNALVGSMSHAGANSTHPRPVHLTYKELNQRAGHLAYQLQVKGVKSGAVAGIMVERSIEMVVGILAILKAGGAYMPINPDFPGKRIAYMLADSAVAVTVTTGSLAEKSGETGTWAGEKVFLEDPVNFNLPSPLQSASSSPSPLAYVIYTSGTTGMAKGVMVEHRSAVNLLTTMARLYRFDKEDAWLLKTSYMFDVSVTELFGWFISGARLAVLEAGGHKDPQILLDTVERENVTHINFVPAMFSLLVNELTPGNIDKLSTLKYIYLAGEALYPQPVNYLRHLYANPELRIENLYGPTEATVYASYYSLTAWNGSGNIPIGRPLENLKLYIIDSAYHLQPVGVPGELIISGVGLARGYLNNPELTAEKFNCSTIPVTTPLYHTGDLVRWLPDGNIEFLGRIDHQVKIRGFRIELGEIEHQLLKHPEIKEAVVVEKNWAAAAGEPVDKYLCAFIVSHREIDIPALRNMLSSNLPDYMIPSYMMAIDRLPLNPTGKVNRNALPTPEVETGAFYIPPADEIEGTLARIWSDLLHIKEDKISTDANFFHLGGHSLKATALVSRIRNQFNVVVPLIEVFKEPTIESLAKCVRAAGSGTPAVPDDQVVLLKPGTENDAHLFLIHDGSGEVEGYMEFCEGLTRPFDCWGLRADRDENLAPRSCTIEEIAREYIKRIREVQADGPYRIAGWSLGGTIAFEMVLQLEKIGKKVDFLGLIDSPGPGAVSCQGTNKFTLESELDWFWEYLPGNEIREKVKKTANINEVWPIIVTHLEENNFNVDLVKPLIPDDLAQIIPHYDQLGIRELISYLNIGRTLIYARAGYIPPKKIQTTLHYFEASLSPGIMRDSWNGHCIEPIKSYKIPGDHFSILKKPGVNHIIKMFENALPEIL